MFGERGKLPPLGINGGASGSLSEFYYPGTDGKPTCPPMVSKGDGIKLEKGQKLLLKTPGGGGYGNPKERDADKVVEDVRLGYVSAKSALQDYFCHLDDKGMLDLEKTNKLREVV